MWNTLHLISSHFLYTMVSLHYNLFKCFWLGANRYQVIHSLIYQLFPKPSKHLLLDHLILQIHVQSHAKLQLVFNLCSNLLLFPLTFHNIDLLFLLAIFKQILLNHLIPRYSFFSLNYLHHIGKSIIKRKTIIGFLYNNQVNPY